MSTINGEEMMSKGCENKKVTHDNVFLSIIVPSYNEVLNLDRRCLDELVWYLEGIINMKLS